MNMDEPDAVASHILRAIEHDRDEYFLGGPESLFVRINQLWPRLVDRVLRRQRRTMELHARASTKPHASS